MPKLEPLDMEKYEIVDEPQNNQDWDGEGNDITTARDKVLGEVSQCPLCCCMTHTVDEKCGKCNSPKKPDSSVDQDKELRAHIRSSFLSYRPEADAALSEYEDGVVTLEEWHASLERITDWRVEQILQLIAQHDAELLGEILKQKRTIGTGELFDECEVVDVSVIEQYQHKQGTDREDA